MHGGFLIYRLDIITMVFRKVCRKKIPDVGRRRPETRQFTKRKRKSIADRTVGPTVEGNDGGDPFFPDGIAEFRHVPEADGRFHGAEQIFGPVKI